MPPNVTRPDRRQVLQTAGAAGLLALAGCLSGDDDEETNGDDDAGMDDGGDDTGTGDETDDLTFDPAPTGEELSEDDIETLIDVFDDEPFAGGQADDGDPHVPSHLFKWVSDETVIFLHFDEPDVTEASQLLWMGVGKKGVFAEDDQPGPEFTHFHQYEADSWEAGHGGQAGDEGYWLTHIAVRDFEAPEWTVDLGVDYDFMPTPPPEFDGDTEPTFEAGGEGGLTDDDIETLVDVFDDEPFEGGQAEDGNPNVPAHISHWVTEETFVFLHFNNPDVTEADDLIYYGIGTRGEFADADRPNGHEEEGEDFTHFHKWHADGWEAGHGGAEGMHGYWLVHHAVRPLDMEWGDVQVGVDRSFMPTEPPV